MVILFYITLLVAIFSPPASAGIFKDEDSLNASHETAQPLNEHIFPGKIIVTYGPNEASWLDYASAFPVGKPGDTSTRTVVSAAHTYITSAISYGNSKRHYCDYQGKRYDIEDTILLGGDKNLITARESIRWAENDIVLYRLKEPIACNPFNDIPRNFEQHVSLTTLTYGWTIVMPENGGIAGNLDGSCAFSFDGEF
ncbi:MAG: hypothetical protein Q8L68_04820, partial [Methylococcales bacterium]|nr:hypothetical protein [Methylococcales bacterium]